MITAKLALATTAAAISARAIKSIGFFNGLFDSDMSWLSNQGTENLSSLWGDLDYASVIDEDGVIIARDAKCLYLTSHTFTLFPLAARRQRPEQTLNIDTNNSTRSTPMRSDQAARDIRKKKTEYISDAAQRQRIGQIEDASQTAEFQDVLQQEADLTAGHGVLRYTGLISVSARTADELDAAVAAIEQAAIQASCETRLLVGQQAQAFTAAALPLCRNL